jgi:hypothetical protein
MAEYMFGVGRGHLSPAVERRANELGAELVNYTEPGCECGYGCNNNRCRARRRHWFTVPELGRGEQVAREIMATLRVDGLMPEGK